MRSQLEPIVSRNSPPYNAIVGEVKQACRTDEEWHNLTLQICVTRNAFSFCCGLVCYLCTTLVYFNVVWCHVTLDIFSDVRAASLV